MVIHENQMEDGNHTYLLNTEQHLRSEKTYNKKMMQEASTLGTITIPKHEHWSDYLHVADDSSDDETQNKQTNLPNNP